MTTPAGTQPCKTITISPLPRPTKETIARAIASHLGIAPPKMSEGSTVRSEFLARVLTALGGTTRDAATTYGIAREILERLDLTYDPRYDTSEHRGRSGGGTVSTRMFSRTLSALTETPRCFLYVTPHGTLHQQHVFFNDFTFIIPATTPKMTALKESGPGTIILVARPAPSGDDTLLECTQWVRVDSLDPGPDSGLTARVGRHGVLTGPGGKASQTQVRLDPPVGALTEIAWSSFRQVVASTGGITPSRHDVEAGADVGGSLTIERLIREQGRRTTVPSGDEMPALPTTEDVTAHTSEDLVPEYSDNGSQNTRSVPAIPRHSHSISTQQKNVLIETRAIDYTLRRLVSLGWVCTRDTQADGVGYDLEFSRDTETRHVEVKGIESSELAFNLTAKEWWRVREDRSFVLAAVTDVLCPDEAYVHLLDAATVAAAKRVATEYRSKSLLRHRTPPALTA